MLVYDIRVIVNKTNSKCALSWREQACIISVNKNLRCKITVIYQTGCGATYISTNSGLAFESVDKSQHLTIQYFYMRLMDFEINYEKELSFLSTGLCSK